MIGNDILFELAKLQLLFTKDAVLVPAILIGYHFIDKKNFRDAAILLFFMMVFNAFLKSIWQIPLPESVKSSSYAFPSGHMASACVFWGWLAVVYRNKSRLFTLLVILGLCGIGSSLIYCGFHVLRDVLGAVFFSGCVLYGYHYLQKKAHLTQQYKVDLTLIVLSCIFIWLLPQLTPIVWFGLAGIVIFSLNSILFKSKETTLKITSTVILLASGIGVMYAIMQLHVFTSNKAMLMSISYAAIAVWATIGIDAINFKNSKKVSN